MEFGNLIEDELMTNSWMFEDVKPFKRVDKKYDERFIKDRKNFIENEASLLELALNISNLYKHKIKYEKEGYLEPILLWLYWKNRETFDKKFKSVFNLGDDPDNETENFIRIYLEQENDVIEEGCTVYPSWFANRYIRTDNDNSYGYEKDETGVNGTLLHYP